MRAINKYIQTFKMGLAKAAEYWSIELVWIVVGGLTPLIFIELWKNSGDVTVGQFNSSEIITYYLTITIIAQIVSPHVDWYIADQINKGQLSFFLMKPYKFFFKNLFEELPFKLFAQVGTIVPIMFFMIFYKRYFYVPEVSLSKVSILILLMLSAYVLMFLIQFIVGCLAFWLTHVRAFLRVFYSMNELFAGRMFPLSLLPVTLLTLSRYLPFKYFWYVPSLFALDKLAYKEVLESIFIMFIWIIITFTISTFIWKKGLKSYSAFGG